MNQYTAILRYGVHFVDNNLVHELRKYMYVYAYDTMHTDIRDTLCTPGMSCQGTTKLIRCSVVLNTPNSMCTIEGGDEINYYLDICSGTVLGGWVGRVVRLPILDMVARACAHALIF